MPQQRFTSFVNISGETMTTTTSTSVGLSGISMNVLWIEKKRRAPAFFGVLFRKCNDFERVQTQVKFTRFQLEKLPQFHFHRISYSYRISGCTHKQTQTRLRSCMHARAVRIMPISVIHIIWQMLILNGERLCVVCAAVASSLHWFSYYQRYI